MDKIQDYINQFEDIKKEWLEQLVLFMREETLLEECFDYKMPTYKGYGFYIAFAAQKNYFSFYTNEVSVLEIFKAEMPSTSLGKSCARIKYKEQDALTVTMQIIKEIILMYRDYISGVNKSKSAEKYFLSRKSSDRIVTKEKNRG